MKKLLLLSMLLIVTQAHAVTTWTSSNCEAKGGVTVTVGAQTFCRSTSEMQWWSAYSWCQAIGGKMPTMWELCPNMSSLTQGAYCSYPTSGAWSTTACNTKYVGNN